MMAVCMISYIGVYAMQSDQVSGDAMDIPTLNQELFDVMSGTYNTTAKQEIVEYLIARGANINAKDSGMPLLCYAIQNFIDFNLDKDFIEFLIDSGASLTMKDNLYRTPLDIASELKLHEVYGIIKFKMLMIELR